MSISKKEPMWVAIPGGVPSDYVVGIIANNIEENSKEMETAIQIAQKFNVPLLKPDLTVIYGNILNVWLVKSNKNQDVWSKTHFKDKNTSNFSPGFFYIRTLKI